MTMKIVRSIREIKQEIKKLRQQDKTIGFVPTMGALHEGHLSLMRMARRQCDIVVVSLFVNPTQFGPNEDYKRYPRDFRSDARQCKGAGVDILFAPAARQIYPQGHRTQVAVGGLGEVLEGASRPGHFAGVATIVLKLLNIIKPAIAYLGQKDYQQTVVIRRMVKDLHLDIKMIVGPTIREPDGLAMSSRNRHLSASERRAATCLWKTLQEGKAMIQNGERDAAKVRSALTHRVAQEPLAKIDYMTVVDLKTLEEIKEVREPALLALAVWIGRTRLIDNVKVRPPHIKEGV